MLVLIWILLQPSRDDDDGGGPREVPANPADGGSLVIAALVGLLALFLFARAAVETWRILLL